MSHQQPVGLCERLYAFFNGYGFPADTPMHGIIHRVSSCAQQVIQAISNACSHLRPPLGSPLRGLLDRFSTHIKNYWNECTTCEKTALAIVCTITTATALFSISLFIYIINHYANQN